MYNTIATSEALADYLFDRPGFLGFVPDHVYREFAAVNQSALKEYLNGPEHYLHSTRNRKESNSFDVGTAVHYAVLEGYEIFKNNVICMPNFDLRRSIDKAEKKLFEEENFGKILLNTQDFVHVERMIEAVYRHPIAGKLFSDGYSEVAGFYQMPDQRDPSKEILCKARMDYIRPKKNWIIDLKTTSGLATKEGFTNSMMKFSYHIQDAFYTDVVEALTGESYEFIFVCVEKRPPYKVGIFFDETDGKQWKDLGRREYQHYLREHQKYISKQKWQEEPKMASFDEPPQWFIQKRIGGI